MNILTIQSLSVEVEDFSLEEINFELKAGEVLGIVGESGSGKTLLSHLIMRLVRDYRLKSGRIEFLGQDVLHKSEAEMQKMRGKEMGYIFQEPLSALNPLQKIHKQLKEAILIHNPTIKKESLQKRIAQLLEDVQLRPQILESYPNELSGGQRQRVCIAIALANAPKLLIADEPTTALDSATQEQILTLLKHLQTRLNLSILFISHNLAIVSKMCAKVLITHKGRIVERGKTQKIFKNPQHAYTKMLLKSLEFKYNKESYAQKLLLETRKLSVQYPLQKSFFGKTLQSFLALSPLSLKLHRGESLGVIGASGSGKSSLANAICGLLEREIVGGEVLFLGERLLDAQTHKLRALRKDLQMIFQDPFSALNPKMNLLQILEEGLKVHFTIQKQEIRKRAQKALEDVGLGVEFLMRYPNELSGGQRQRVCIARSLILRPQVLILDEPTSALDCATQKQILQLLLRLAKQYKLSYLCISHNLNVIATLCQNVLVLKDGKMLEYGATKNVFSAPKNPYVRNLLKASALE